MGQAYQWGLETPRAVIQTWKYFGGFFQDLDRLVLGGNNARPEYQGVLAALAGSDPKGATPIASSPPTTLPMPCESLNRFGLESARHTYLW